MAEMRFYHLERHELDQVLPNLLERTLARGWRAVVQATTKARLAQLDQWLWTYSEESFLPHGAAGDGPPARQPIYLTLDADNPNDAQVRFCVEGADPLQALDAGAAHERVAVLFDGRDDAQLDVARRQWAELKALPHIRQYWQADETGRFIQRA